MCGIAGMACREALPGNLYISRRRGVLDAIRHRGPDASGEYSDQALWLGHVRLSILDLSSAGNQPMATEDGGLIISYNGEVYNFRELASELSLVGLRSHSDTEVVLRGFEKMGSSLFPRLNGMFAFALYDKREQKLWLVRDRLGIKPLYYLLDRHRLIFASEIKSIGALIDEGLECDVSSLHEWIYYGNTLGGKTLYKGVGQLKPGHCLEIGLRTFEWKVYPYWSLEEQACFADASPVREKELIAETRRLLEEAVRRQLVSDVPVGVFLSGGVDSSAITAFASRHYVGRLTTYSAGFDDLSEKDERPMARRVARHFNTDHNEFFIHGGGVADLIEKMVHHHDMPFSDAANIPLYLMASHISGTTKVVLQGDGGDEVFGGYRRYVTLRYRHLLHFMALGGQHFHCVLRRTPFHHRVRRYLHAFAADDVAVTMAMLLTPHDPHASPTAIFTPAFREVLERSDPFARYRECHRFFSDHDIGNRMSLVDLMIVLPDIFLEKVDRATMATSLEVRVPFLDHDLVDYVVRIPGKVKMPWGQKKWLLKKALRGIVPDDVLDGPKTGFNVPYGFWLRTSLKPMFFDHLERFSRTYPGVVDGEYVCALYESTRGGEQGRMETIWNLLNLMIWFNTTKTGIVL